MSEDREYIHRFVLMGVVVGPFALSLAFASRMVDEPAATVISVVGYTALAGCAGLIWWGYRITRRLNDRIAHSLCPHCGYDLRATPGRCPECGKTPDRTEAP